MNKYRLRYILHHKKETFKEYIAYFILDRFNYCWADLVMWYMGYSEWGDVGKVTPEQCIECAYCGKYLRYLSEGERKEEGL